MDLFAHERFSFQRNIYSEVIDEKRMPSCLLIHDFLNSLSSASVVSSREGEGHTIKIKFLRLTHETMRTEVWDLHLDQDQIKHFRFIITVKKRF